jgi:hypothetical protein
LRLIVSQDDATADEGTDPLRELLDVFVFAPIGAFLHGPETVGDLATKGRQDVANARFIGRMALDRSTSEGREQVGAFVEDMTRRGIEVLVAAARAAGLPFDGERGATPDGDAESEPHLRVVPPDPTATSPEAAEAGDPSHGGPAVDSLAIPGYDTLAASQVVPRLDDLSDTELADVQDYERAHRGRMTILSRIAQLRAS